MTEKCFYLTCKCSKNIFPTDRISLYWKDRLGAIHVLHWSDFLLWIAKAFRVLKDFEDKADKMGVKRDRKFYSNFYSGIRRRYSPNYVTALERDSSIIADTVVRLPRRRRK